VSADAYFSAAELDRARRFSRPQLALYLLRGAVDAAVLVAVARRPPRRLLARVSPTAAGAGAAGMALSAGLAAIPLPLSAVARQRALNAGLATQSWAAWAMDVFKSTALGAALTGAGAALAVALIRRAPAAWWVPGGVLAVAAGAGLQFAAPVLIDPLFNRFVPLPAGPTRDDVLDLAARAGVRVGQVYQVDASRRTTAANAYVTGLGATKRVVLYDTLLENFSREEARLVVAHELAHVRHRDVARGLAYMALVAPWSALAVKQLSGRLGPVEKRSGTGPEVLPALGLSLALVSAPMSVIANQLSRRMEARADAFALSLTEAPEAFISFEQRIAVRNLIDPDPPRWVTLLLGTHPSIVKRIGAALAYETGAGDGAPVKSAA
jgi:STE24 endopeptidase